MALGAPSAGAYSLRMAPLAALLLSLSLRARAQTAPGVPVTPESRAADLREQFQKVMRPQPVSELLGSYAEEKKRRDKADFALSSSASSEAEPGTRGRFDASTTSRLYGGRRVRAESVELSFLRPVRGLTAGVGWGDSREFLGENRGPENGSKFGFVRLQLGKRDAGPKLFLPAARVAETEQTDRFRLSVDEYSIRDLPKR